MVLVVGILSDVDCLFSHHSSFYCCCYHKMNTGYDLNRVNLTQDEQTCILKFLREAQDCGYPSSNEPFYPIINSILRKYYDSDIKEAQFWQTA